MYDAAEPGAGYDKLIELEANNVYTGGFDVSDASSEVLYHQSFDENAFLPTDWLQYSLADTTHWYLHSDMYASAPYCLAHYHVPLNSDDWIVLPLMTLPENAYIAFQERNDAAITSNYEHHGIWVSTGSGDPNDGDFELAAEFGYYCSSWVWQGCTLSQYAGQDVYVAFHYMGYDESAWYIDNVFVSYYQEPYRVKIAGNGATLDLGSGCISVNSNIHLDIDRAVIKNGGTALMYSYSSQGRISNCVFYDCVQAILQASINEVTIYNTIFAENYYAVHKTLPGNPIHLSYNCYWNNQTNFITDKPC
jgi:hypothetical protein